MNKYNQQINELVQKQGIKMPCYCYTQLASTNDYAKSFCTIDDRFVIVARSQSRGKGRYDRAFLSSRDKGVYMSYCFNSPLTADYSLLSAIVCLAVVNLLSEYYGIQCTIKWPNDVLIEGKKVCGILNESVVKDNKRLTILGIGLNVLYSQKQLSVIDRPCTSVNLHTNMHIDLRTITAQLIECTDVIVRHYQANQGSLIAQYKAQCDIVGKSIFYQGCQYLVTDLTDDLSLIATNHKGTCTINHGEITTIL